MTKLNNSGFLVISLDFELLWGIFDKVDWRNKKEYFENTKEVIPQILQLFQEYGIHATWATVGMLFNRGWNQWKSNYPKVIPYYKNEKLNPYEYGTSIVSPSTEEFCFAPDLIKQINSTHGQELATHTYSHYYCKEEGQKLKMFKSDLQVAVKLSKTFGIELKSLVFPRNQFNEEYVKICEELGIENIRTNPSNWYWNNPEQDTLSQKIFRSGDAYFGFHDKSYNLKDLKANSNAVIHQKASRMLRPFSSNRMLEFFKLRRIKEEISHSAKHKKIYHLWWHPHNFGEFPKESLNQLETILKHYQYCNKKYDFESLTMAELGNRAKYL
ncbi:polysaccharide deacetylase family protein [Gramella lutea]|uniref:Polysaccharide deacetylase family protein n=1 Tax=Christiangramia lutea TaxID=1607951 RepID=A0A9X2A9Q1_9FLAO|nr:polysaccharide deacetylase family protein [Christiangramia lutea]MCH4823809.1 polysaccharide deacetylase family protein [Christiangramia lutea]